MGIQPPASGPTGDPPFQGTAVLALRPACASCIPATDPCESRNRTMRARKSTWASCQMPRSCGLMRPSGVTAVASVKTRAARPTAREPRCTRCQSLANPSSLEYWHIGENENTIRELKRADGKRFEQASHEKFFRKDSLTESRVSADSVHGNR